jgi:hypothetical protein
MSQISDTSFNALGHVHTLFLSECDKVSDVSALGHVHTLCLSRCDKVSDVSALEPWSHLRGGRNIFDNVVV